MMMVIILIIIISLIIIIITYTFLSHHKVATFDTHWRHLF